LAFVVAGLVAAEDDLAFLLGFFLEKVRAAAVGAGLRDGLVVRREAARGVARGAVEETAPASLALDHLSLAAVGAQQADLARFLLLHVFAVGVVAAGDERAEAPA